MLDGDAALEGLTAFLARFRKVLNPLFDGIRKSRDMERCLYEGRTFLWTFIVGHLARLGSRNAMDANRNDPKYADAILKLADQGVWPEGERKTAPCTLSCCNFLSRGFPVQMINLLQHICMVSTSAIKHSRRFLFVFISRSVAHKVSCCNSIGHP